MSKVLVTGGAGFIGSHLVDRLIADGHEVVVLDNLSTGKREQVNPKASFIKCDIGNFEETAPHFAGIEAVFHTAALARIQPSIQNPLVYNQTNVTGTLNVLWAAREAGVRKLIYSASSSAYGERQENEYPLKESLDPRPGSPYALQKYVGELYCRLFSKLYGLPTVILRYFNVYGPRQITEGAYAAVIGIFLKQREQGSPMTVVGDGQQRRDFTHVSDVVEANMLVWQKPVPTLTLSPSPSFQEGEGWGEEGEIFNIGAGRNYSVNEIAKLIGGPTVNIPPRPGEYPMTLADNSKARQMLGWEPKVKLEEAIEELKKLHGITPSLSPP